MHDVLDVTEILGDELIQRRESGYDVDSVADQVAAAIAGSDRKLMDEAFRALDNAELRPDWAYVEPTEHEAILATLVDPPVLSPLSLTDADLQDRITAAWLGRCAGCNLGKPVEGWSRERIKRYLDLDDAYPITDYLPQIETTESDLRLNGTWPDTTRGNVRYMARDDDIDYTILGLHILEVYGRDFGPMDVAREWLNHLPFTQVFTAERAAYRNLLLGLEAPETATYRNPYREWIGAQIRADMWGYVNPGDPGPAVAMAYSDASLSHTQNGIYGEMWAAALISAAFTTTDVREIIEVSLAYVPPRSRLAEAIRDTIALFDSGIDWESARDAIEERYYSQYCFVHTINNAALITAALLWGDGDYTRTIGLAVQGGWDTDCTGATAGSVFGAMHGTESLPGHWVAPLNDLIRSAIMGYDQSRLSELAERTLRLVEPGPIPAPV